MKILFIVETIIRIDSLLLRHHDRISNYTIIVCLPERFFTINYLLNILIYGLKNKGNILCFIQN